MTRHDEMHSGIAQLEHFDQRPGLCDLAGWVCSVTYRTCCRVKIYTSALRRVEQLPSYTTGRMCLESARKQGG
jgi:hypothetical protein